MIGRYNPHQIQNQAKSWMPTGDGDFSLPAQIKHLGQTYWQGIPIWLDPLRPAYSVQPAILREYGADAVRLAALGAPNLAPDETLLESAHRWLSLVYASFSSPTSSSHARDWRPEPWLWAACTANDHLLSRERVYPALAAIKKAWKESPVTANTCPAGKQLCLTLLFPFIPYVTRWLMNTTFAEPVPLSALCHEFLPHRPIRIGMEKSGWRWEVVNGKAFDENPHQCISHLPWVEKALPHLEWHLQAHQEGYRICLNQPNKKNANSCC